MATLNLNESWSDHSDLEGGVRAHLRLAEVPGGAVAVTESPDGRHHQLIAGVDSPGPDGEFAQVGPGGVHDGLVHEVPEGHAPRPGAPVHLLADEEGPVARLLHVVPGQLDEEAALATRGVIVQWEPAALHGRVPLPLQLVHVVPTVGVLPAALVVLEAAVARTAGGHLRCSGADPGGDRDVVYSDVTQSVTTHDPFEHDLERRGVLVPTLSCQPS